MEPTDEDFSCEDDSRDEELSADAEAVMWEKMWEIKGES